MDPKYTEAEQTNRELWKKRATEAQTALETVKLMAIQREKRERDQKAQEDNAKMLAKKAVAEADIQARGLVDALLYELGKLEKTHGVKPVSWEAQTVATNGQVNITVQFAKVGQPRDFSTRW